jgi:GAF domain-containing protein/anti-sigma regulatory factor (Ser/Thr protein kinase)
VSAPEAAEGDGRGDLASRWTSAPVGLAVFDHSLRCVEANPRFVELATAGAAGSSGPVEGRGLDELVGPGAHAITSGVAVFAASGSAAADAAGEEVRIGAVDGSERWVLCRPFHAGPDDDGRPLVGVVLVDISDRKVTEARHVALQRLSAAFAATVEPAAVAEVVIRAVREAVGATGGALYLLDATRTRLVALRTGYPWPAGSPMFDVPVDEEMPVTTAVRTNEAQWVYDRGDLITRFRDIERVIDPDQPWGAHAALPISLSGEVLGSMVFSWSHPLAFTPTDRTFLEAVAGQCAQALDRALLFARERAAREHTERVADQVLRLERITGALAVANEPEEVIDRFLDECLAETGASYGGVLLVDAAKRALVPVGSRSTAEWSPRSVLLDGHGPLAEAFRSRQSLLLDDREQIRRMVGNQTMPLTDEQAWAVVPLVAYGDALGIAALRYAGPRQFDGDDRAFLDRVGRRLAEAIDRSRLYAHQREAREQAEAAARWLRSVQSLAAALARSATRKEVARALREHLHPATRADYSIVAALDPERRSLDVLTGTATFAVSTEQLRSTVQGAVRELILRGRSIELVDPDEIQATFPGLVDAGLGSFTLLPVRSGRSVVAVIGLGWSRPAALSGDARRLLAIAVSLGGAAFERAAAYDLDHHIAETLQMHLLTAPDFESAELAWAARYEPGSVELTAGGDWYDVIRIDEHRVALVVGDIVGHGVVAAAAMGQLRSATRALVVREEPAGVLEALDSYVTTSGQGNLSSVALVVVDTTDGLVTYAVAGHPAPLERAADGTTAFVEEARGPLLGIAAPGTRRAVSRRIDAGTSIVLYTDGLVERRGEVIDDGMARLAGIVADADPALHPEGVCDHLLERLAEGGKAADDITVLVGTFDARGPRRRRRFPARLEMLRVIRSEVRGWLEANGVEPSIVGDVVLACDEACANSIEHGLRATAAESIEVSLELDGDDVVVTIADTGSWSDRPSGDHRGRGLDIMRALMDSVDITLSPGTTVTMRRRRRAST